MATESDLVIGGSVATVGTGPTVGGGEAGPAFTLRELVVDVESVIKGPEDLTTVTVLGEGIDADGRGYSINGRKWASEGARAVFFLVEMAGVPGVPDGTYRLTNSQSRFFLDGETVVPNSAQGRRAPFEGRLAGGSADDFLREVESL